MDIKKAKIPTLRNKLHTLMSLYIRRVTNREYHGCPFHIINHKKLVPIECCFHFVKRQHSIITWEPLNLIGACNGCNFDMNYRPERYWEVFDKIYGPDARYLLVKASRHPAKFSKANLIDFYSFWRDKMEKNIVLDKTEKIRRIQAIVASIP